MSLYDTFRRRSIPAPVALAIQYSDPFRMRLDTGQYPDAALASFVKIRLAFFNVQADYLRAPEMRN